MTKPEERIAQALETGEVDDLGPGQREAVGLTRSALRDETIWAEPPPDLEQSIAARVLTEPDRGRQRQWFWMAAAVLAIVAGTAAITTAINSDTREPTAVIAMEGTALAPNVTGTAGLIPTPNGWAIELNVQGLPPAPQGTYYQGWVNNGQEAVSVGTFHMRGERPTPVALWSGVDLAEFNQLNITIQEVGGGPESSGRIVLTGATDVPE